MVFIGGFLAFITIIGVVGKWLLTEWVLGQKEIQRMKENQTSSAISQLEKAVDSIQLITKNHETALNQAHEKLRLIEVRIAESLAASSLHMKTLTDLATNVLNFIHKPSDKSEAIKISEELYLLRKKKEEE